jgi:LacI family transcriptional regulator
MKVTLKLIAEQANVSISTVSLALNSSPKIKTETRRRIQALAAKLGYVPDLRARALVKGKTGIIAVVVPRLDNYFFSELTQSIKNEMKKAAYNVILCSTDNKTSDERKYIDVFKSGLVDGAIFGPITNSVANHEEIIALMRSHISVVFIDRFESEEYDSEKAIPLVMADLKKAAFNLTEYLIEQGHRKIEYVGLNQVDGNIIEERLKGFTSAMNEHGLEFSNEQIIYSVDSYAGGIAGAETILKQKDLPTALICMNDEIAMGVMHSLKQVGIKIPDDISVCGTDDLKISSFASPPLTTVNIDKKKMGKKAAEMLLRLMSGDNIPSEQRIVEIPTELVIRESTTSPGVIRGRRETNSRKKELVR